MGKFDGIIFTPKQHHFLNMYFARLSVIKNHRYFCKLQGFHIPKGWGILYCITDTHENADTFNKEERPQFKPERWEYQRKTMQCNGNIKHLEKFEYLPFGGGGRRCVGKEFALLFLRLFIVEMCRSCDWKLQKGDVMPEMKTSPIPFPADGMPLCIKKAEL